MKLLALTNGGFTKLDDEDYEIYKLWTWYSTPDGLVRRTDSNRKTVYLHKEIVKFAYSYLGETDHKDRDNQNNQKANLRPATHSDNIMNSGIRSDNSSGYKGVNYNNHKNRYHARIQVRGVRISLGYFTELEKAARAYDKAAKHYHGEFAWLNFPEAL